MKKIKYENLEEEFYKVKQQNGLLKLHIGQLKTTIERIKKDHKSDINEIKILATECKKNFGKRFIWESLSNKESIELKSLKEMIKKVYVIAEKYK